VHVIALRARGQALVETAVALPVFLLAMFGVVWALQTGVVGERIQLVARYGGMVSAEINPYQQYSLYSMYAAAGNSAAPVACSAPPAELLANGAPLASPAPAAQAFWQPTSGSTLPTTTCTRTYSVASGLSTPKIFGSANVAVNATNDVPSLLQPFLGTAMPWNATMNQMRSPDMTALAACYPELSVAFQNSVHPPNPAPALPSTDVPPITAPDTAPLSPDGGCLGP
jgi:hypothetical protein